MGKIALWVFIASLATVPIAMTTVVAAALRIFRTLRYARQDFQAYQRLFAGRLESAQDLRERIAGRHERIGEELRRAGENWEETREALEELAHPSLGSILRSLLSRP